MSKQTERFGNLRAPPVEPVCCGLEGRARVWTFRAASLPEGDLTIARQFTAGWAFALASVPKGRLNPYPVHLLLSLPATMAMAKAMQLIKGGSSKWVHETFPKQRPFGWQTKYGAFSVSVSQVDRIVGYIENQETHHRRRTFQEEFIALLRKHRIAYDERYLWE